METDERRLKEQQLYLGRKPVNLMGVTGEFHAYVPGKTVLEIPSVKTTQAALKRLQDCSDLGEEYSRVYLPALPSADLLLTPSEPTSSPLPISVKSPLPSDMQGIQSGKRSAVVWYNETQYRLKGCGNLEQGFVVEPMAFPEDGRELRGCCFEQTMARELYMSQVIADALRPHGYEVGNVPIGYWKYTEDSTQTVQFALPLIPKYCGVYETFGEKRLGSHLLTGLTTLAEHLNSCFDINALKQLFPAERCVGEEITPTKALRVTSGPTDNGPYLQEFTTAGVYRNNEKLLDFLSKQWEITIKNPDFSLFWLSSDHFSSDISLPTSSLTSSLAFLAYRIGRETGEVKRHLQDSEISWGFYIDHNPFEPHCNAHPNNFLVLNACFDHITAPIDFDMAFTFRGFMNNLDEQMKGVHDYTLFQSFVNSERGALEEALAGVENMANFQYKETRSGETALETALKDMVVLGYREGFDLRADRYPVQVRGNAELWRTVELCLACSMDYTDY